MNLIDIGANLTHESFDHDRDEVIDVAHAAGVEKLVITGASEVESVRAAKLASARPGSLYSTAGVHPHLASEWGTTTPATIRELLEQPQVKAVGECGLDFNRDFSPRDIQRSVFEAHLDIASDTGYPLFLHQRDAHEAFMEILTPRRPALSRIVVHCFTDTETALRDYLDLDCYIGITGWICDERRGTGLRDLVKLIPADRLLIETDAPYLLPRDLRPKPKSRRNEPKWLPHIAGVIAHCRGEPVEAVAQNSYRNSVEFFQLD